MITDLSISAARTLFACCSLNYLNEYRKAARYGEEDICDRNLWIYMLWAKGIMSRTPLMTEINGSIVVADAGTTAINGTYYPSGTNAEGIVYTLTTDPYTYIHLDGGVWNLMYDDSPYYYQSSVGVAATPADATWSANFGASPVPTFTLLEVSGKCVSREFAEQVFDKAKCFCEVCGCTPAATPTPVDCTITPDFTVDTVIDSAQVAETEANNQVDGFAYYIVSIVGGSGASPGQIGTYSTTLGGWQYNNPAPGSVILDSSTGIYWVDYAYPDIPAPMFPPINSTSDGAGEYVIQSAFPYQSVGLSGNVVVEMFDGGLAWATVYTGTAASLATSVVLTLAEPGYNQIRVTYTVGACTYQYFNGVITAISNPPASGRSLQGPIYCEIVYADNLGQLFNPLTQGWSISFRSQFENTAFPDGTIPAATLGMQCDNVVWSFLINADPMSGVIEVIARQAAGSQEARVWATVPPWAGPTGDGNWHHIGVTRDPVAIDDWSPSRIKLYFDGVNIPLTQGTTMSYAAPDVVLPDEYLYIALSPIEANSRCWIDEMYACDHVCTPLEVMNVLKANTMAASDGAWGRQFWYRVESSDSDTEVENVITPAKLPLGVLGGNGVISTNVDPSI